MSASADVAPAVASSSEVALPTIIWPLAIALEPETALPLTDFSVFLAHGPEYVSSSEKTSPFDEIDERRGEEEKIAELISYIRCSLKIPYARKLAQRIEQLIQIAEEEAPHQSPPSVRSLRSFVRLLVFNPDLRHPDVMLVPSGNFRIQWRAGRDKLCAAEFYDEGKTYFVVFAPDPNRPSETIRLSGSASVESFVRTVAPHGPLEWMQR